MPCHFLLPRRPRFDSFFARKDKRPAYHQHLLTKAIALIRLRCVASVGMVLCLLSTSTPAAPQTIIAVTGATATSLAFWYRASGFPSLFQDRGNARGQEKQSDRDDKVSRLQIFPGDVTIDVSEHVRFTAVAYDAEGNAVGGIKIKWRAQGAIPNQKAHVSQHGEFEAVAPGTFTVIAQANGKTAQTTVTVRPGPRRNLNAPVISTREVSSRDVPKTQLGSAREHASSGARTAKGVNRLSGFAAKRAHANRRVPVEPDPMPQGGGGGWNDSNYWSADDPGNRVGDPPGSSPNGGAGSGNFQFAAPVYSSPGRGINISLGLAYNSRVWNKANTQISFDNDRGWPAPGFSLGFGKMLGIGVYTGCMLVDADGTRHSYAGNISFYYWGTHGIMHTTDGSFIDYEYWTGTNGYMTSAYAKLPNGTVINYGAYSQPGGGLFPVSIEDANGNYINITYVNNSGPRIQTVMDTLGRVVSFYYDSNNLLTAINGPGLSGGTRTLVRLHYSPLTLNYSFSGLTPVVNNSTPWVLDAIYYPATNTGYWLGDDAYSSYGMLTKVIEQRGMSFSDPGLNAMGTVSQGSVTRAELYNYPRYVDDPDSTRTQSSNLTDAPTYTSMKEQWTPDGSSPMQEAVTQYEVHENDYPRTTTITLPNGTRTKQSAFNAPGQYNDGLVYQDVTFVTNENSPLQSSHSYWEQGAYDSPRPTRVEKTDERGQTTAAEFSYGSVYNQVTEVRDYDYGGLTLLRLTRTSYQNSSSYTGSCNIYGCWGPHILNLPLTVEIFDGSSNRLTRTEYQYDGQTLSATPNVVQHDQAYNPQAAAEGFCYYDYDWSDPDCNGSCDPELFGCDGYCPQNYYCPYQSWTDYRGNVTQVTNYANVDNSSATNAITETKRYDVTGNLIKASTSCCEQTSFTYTIDTQFAYSQSKTRGSATDSSAQVTISANYDFATGLVNSATDENGRPSSTSYNSASLRPTTASLPSGAHTDYSYDDNLMKVASTTYLSTGGIADQSVKFLNGRGQVRIEKARGVDSGGSETWDEVDTGYNSLGDVSQQSKPYRAGSESPINIMVAYDALGRAISVTAPDGSVSETFYNEATRPDVASSSQGETKRVKDAWGRERWGRTDTSGRLVEVIEPNPAGDGSVASGGLVTTYSYDTLGKLVTITQGSQTRFFKYDSLGRLTAQKLAEQAATINDSGVYVGSGGTGALWSDYFRYENVHSNLVQRIDPRGVKTNYWYFNPSGHTDPGDGTAADPLNRIQSVSWDASAANQNLQPTDPNYVLSAATVSYQYRNRSVNTSCDPLDSSGRKDVSQPATVTTAGVSTNSMCYDTEGRVSSRTLTLNSRSSYSFVTNYSYDTLDRVTDVEYPAQYGNGNLRKTVHQNYDLAGRLSGLTYNSQSFASNISYNAASQTTSLTVGNTNPVTENYNYNSQTGLLENQTFTRGGSTLLDLTYDYADANGKRTGQLRKINNNRDHAKDRGYEYDALGRLQRATGGQNVNWVQRYQYDRYGNRWNAFSYTAADYVTHIYQSAGGQTPPDLQGDLGTLQQAYGQGQFLTAMRDIANAAFTSSAYATHEASISNEDYVKELYRAYLYREADDGGLQAWKTVLDNQTATRAQVRAGFRDSVEFQMKINATSPYSPTTAVAADGLQGMSYDLATNRVNASGFSYDAAGNQTQITQIGSAVKKFQYDAANRLISIKDANNNSVAAYTYGSSNERLIGEEYGQGTSVRTYYVGEGGSTIAEYSESGGSTTPLWSKSYVYLGNRLLSTLTPDGSNGESVEYHHPDRLGTRLITNASGVVAEQATLPFGTSLATETSGTPSKRRFTSYDRNETAALDYAVNRDYDSQQGRFTQVDPAGMGATNLGNPQTMNLYAYCSNDPVNRVDPDGLGLISFFKKLIRGIAKILTNKWVLLIVGIALGALSGFAFFLAFAEAAPGATVAAFYLKAAIALAAMSAILIVGASHPNFLRVIQTAGGIMSTARGAAGLINRTVNGTISGTLGTPPWNPNAGSGVGPLSRFQGATEQALSPAQGSLVWNVLEVARVALEKESCRRYVGQAAYQALRKLWDDRRIKYFHGSQFAANEAPSWAVTITKWGRTRIVIGYDFFDDARVDEDSIKFGLSRIQARALTLLHEARHVLCNGCGYAEPHDQWDEDIVKNCF